MKMIASLIAALFATLALAGTTYQLPNPAITVNPNYSNTTTLVTIGSVTWRGPSAFYYVGECQRPDDSGYRCNILQEDNVTLTAPGHAPIAVTIAMQSASILIRSGHNYWRSSDTVLNGAVTLP